MTSIVNKYWFRKFFYAFRGFYSCVREEKSMTFHIILLILIVILSFGLKISINSWIPIIITFGFVLTVELLNTSLENMIDMICFEYNINAQKIKDISAAATLVVAIIALTVSLLVYIPRVMEIINGNY